MDDDQPPGLQVLKNQDFAAYAKGNLLPTDGLDPVLVQKVRPLFLRGDYETAILQAFKEVEVRFGRRPASGQV